MHALISADRLWELAYLQTSASFSAEANGGTAWFAMMARKSLACSRLRENSPFHSDCGKGLRAGEGKARFFLAVFTDWRSQNPLKSRREDYLLHKREHPGGERT